MRLWTFFSFMVLCCNASVKIVFARGRVQLSLCSDPERQMRHAVSNAPFGDLICGGNPSKSGLHTCPSLSVQGSPTALHEGVLVCSQKPTADFSRRNSKFVQAQCFIVH